MFYNPYRREVEEGYAGAIYGMEGYHGRVLETAPFSHTPLPPQFGI